MRANHRVSVDAGARKADPSPASSALEMFSSLNSAPLGMDQVRERDPSGAYSDATRTRLFEILVGDCRDPRGVGSRRPSRGAIGSASSLLANETNFHRTPLGRRVTRTNERASAACTRASASSHIRTRSSRRPVGIASRVEARRRGIRGASPHRVGTRFVVAAGTTDRKTVDVSAHRASATRSWCPRRRRRSA